MVDDADGRHAADEIVNKEGDGSKFEGHSV